MDTPVFQVGDLVMIADDLGCVSWIMSRLACRVSLAAR